MSVMSNQSGKLTDGFGMHAGGSGGARGKQWWSGSGGG
jgi:hypothetical protein